MKDQKSNVNAMWTHFQTKLEKSIDVNVPHKIARKKDGSPWITPDIKRLIRKRDNVSTFLKLSGWFVTTRSMVLDPLVGYFTSCAIPLSSNMSANFS
jgi:hypothetical protein